MLGFPMPGIPPSNTSFSYACYYVPMHNVYTGRGIT